MRIRNSGIALTLLASTLLAGCGGGGGGGSSNAMPAGPVVSALSFPLQSAQKALAAAGRTNSFTLSITAVSGTTALGPCSGSGSATDAPATTPTTFEGKLALSSVSTLTITSPASPGCNAVNITQNSTNFFDSNFVPVGNIIVGGDYSVFLIPPSVPTSVKVGDTGTIGTETSFTDSTKATPTGTVVTSYVIEADTSTTAIVNLISTNSDTAGTLTSTEEDRFRITAVGALTPISTILLSADASRTRVVLTYN
jgi:hypothetical protein